jgi:chromosomal replication initiator protein
MTSAAIDQVFSVPLRHLWSTNFSGATTATPDRPLGLARFVGDEPNEILAYLLTINENGTLAQDEAQWPLVLFGPSGTGKTSLALTVVSNLADRLNNDRSTSQSAASPASRGKPIFLSALDFDRRFRSALETDSVPDFRKRLIQSTGLVIDDLHRLVAKPAAQNEFMLILDEMCRKNRPIVVTMDVPPQLCGGLSAQLVSRLSGGLSLPVNPPGPSARMEIIRDLARINQVVLTDDAINMLVNRLNVTVPKLDHFFAQIKTALRNEDDSLEPVDAAKLTRLFQKSDSDVEKLAQLIIKQVAAEFHLKVSELKSNSRKQSIVMARGVAIYLNRVLLGTSYLKIGSYFGNRDHSTILHANRKINNLIADDRNNVDGNSIKNIVSKLKQQLAEQFGSQVNFL